VKKPIYLYIIVVLTVLLSVLVLTSCGEKAQTTEPVVSLADAIKNTKDKAANVKLLVTNEESANASSQFNQTSQTVIERDGDKVRLYVPSSSAGYLSLKNASAAVPNYEYYHKEGYHAYYFAYNGLYGRWDKTEVDKSFFSWHEAYIIPALTAEEFTQKNGFYEMNRSAILAFVRASKLNQSATNADGVDYVRIKVKDGYVSEYELKTTRGENANATEYIIRVVFSDFGTVSVALPNTTRTDKERFADMLIDIRYFIHMNFTLEFTTDEDTFFLKSDGSYSSYYERFEYFRYYASFDGEEEIVIMSAFNENAPPMINDLYEFNAETNYWEKSRNTPKDGEDDDNVTLIDIYDVFLSFEYADGTYTVTDERLEYAGNGVTMVIYDIGKTLVEAPATYVTK